MWIIFLILMCSVAQADVYVITAPDKSVVSLSEADDAVIPKDYKKNVLINKGIKDLPVKMGEESMYDFDGGKFTLNAKKVEERNSAEQAAILAAQKKDADKKSAIDKFKDAIKLTDDEVKALFN